MCYRDGGEKVEDGGVCCAGVGSLSFSRLTAFSGCGVDGGVIWKVIVLAVLGCIYFSEPTSVEYMQFVHDKVLRCGRWQCWLYLAASLSASQPEFGGCREDGVGIARG